MTNEHIDQLAFQSAFGSDTQKQSARYEIWTRAQEQGIYPASINNLYMARGANKLPATFSVPAMNLRGMAYDMARTVFEVAKKRRVGALICELARSEMGYTAQPPSEYASIVLAGALRAGWTGPVFIQCDHFTVKEQEAGLPQEGEIDALKELIHEAVNAGFYNVDIDMSTLVHLERPTVEEQQAANIKYSADMAIYVRSIEPKDITISLGGEIGHIGGVNSTVADFRAFVEGFNATIGDAISISKVAIQTGSSHGGVVLPDGSLQEVEIDFSLLKSISQAARKEYGIGGPVQHGASTLPEEFFSQFTQHEALEVHLATGFQNTQMDHPAFPATLRQQMYTWVDTQLTAERKPDWTDDQFHYKLRKKGWGQFKQATWEIADTARAAIRDSLAQRFDFLYKQLGVYDTVDMVAQYAPGTPISKSKADFAIGSTAQADVSELAD